MPGAAPLPAAEATDASTAPRTGLAEFLSPSQPAPVPVSHTGTVGR